MTTEELFKSMDSDQTKALNALLIEQRDALTAAHVQGLQDMVTAKAEEIASLVAERDSQASGFADSIGKVNEQLTVAESELARKETALSAIKIHLQLGEAAAMVEVFNQLERPEKEKQAAEYDAKIAELQAQKAALNLPQ